MLDVTLGIAILLGAGLFFAKIAQLFHLPSVTGYIVAGLALGPSGLDFITTETVGHQLDHFTQIALMLIAFGIGEHIELRRLQHIAKDVTYISVVQAIGAYLFVFITVFPTAVLLTPEAAIVDNLVLALLLSSVAVATAPAALLLVVRELKARGPVTSTLMAVIAVDDGICIMIFGITLSIGHQLLGNGAATPLAGVIGAVSEIGFSLLIGIATGFVIDFVLHKLHRRGEMLTAGLSMLLFCGEITRLLHLSPLLAGMMAGFVLINRAERDIRLFRTLNHFEPPIYVLFFTLAGAHLDLAALKLAGWIGAAYIIARILGKYLGSWLGALLSGSSAVVRNWLGLALIPQAGVAIGLVFMISSDPQLSDWATVITPVVLAGVMLSELFGPLLVRLTLQKAGETSDTRGPKSQAQPSTLKSLLLSPPPDSALVPWEGPPLHPVANSQGLVLFGATHFTTVRGLARVATILAHHYHALPKSIRVLSPKAGDQLTRQEEEDLFMAETDETASLGYPLLTELACNSPEAGLLAVVERDKPKALVVGYPLGHKPLAFRKVLTSLTDNADCPVIGVRFVGTFSFERILVPFLYMEDLEELLPILEAMSTAGQPKLTLLHLAQTENGRRQLAEAEQRLLRWRQTNLLNLESRQLVLAAQSRLEGILSQSENHDLIIIKSARKYGIRRMFAGSLANSVVQHCRRSVFAVHIPPNLAVKKKSRHA